MVLSVNFDVVMYVKVVNIRIVVEIGDCIEWVKLLLVFLLLVMLVSDVKVLIGCQKFLIEVVIIIVEICSCDGFEGVGFSYFKCVGGQGIYVYVKEIVDNLLGEDFNDIDKIYIKLLWVGVLVGCSGMVVQVIFFIDIVLWDMKVKCVGLLLVKLLGVYCDFVQCYNILGGFLYILFD